MRINHGLCGPCEAQVGGVSAPAPDCGIACGEPLGPCACSRDSLRETLPQAWACGIASGEPLGAIRPRAPSRHTPGITKKPAPSGTGLFVTPDAIRTRDLLLRRQSLYPTELRERVHRIVVNIRGRCQRRRSGSAQPPCISLPISVSFPDVRQYIHSENVWVLGRGGIDVDQKQRR
jgi:hypothetical protein